MATNNNNLARPRRVLNKNPAPVQITAEQILREARELQQQSQTRAPKRKINDASELDDYRSQKRKNFEQQTRNNNNVWSKYAAFEESQKDFVRVRSAFERVLVSDYRNHTLWLKYAEFEMRNKFVSYARNVLDRAVELLPRVDQLWYKYVHMEEMLGNVAAARRVFDRWMKWMPDSQAWISYVEFEMRYKEADNAREVFERFVGCHGSNVNAEPWIRYAEFEVNNGEMERARKCYKRAVDKFVDNVEEEEEGKLYVAFAEFEENCCNQIENARCVYKYALNRIPEGRVKEELYKKFHAFEKAYGDRGSIEDGIVGKRRIEYEDEVRKNPFSYDAWFDYIRLEESCGDKQRIDDVYKRALANVPPANEKRYWQRYIYVWVNYFLYLELDAENVDGTREAYVSCLKLIPHKKFSFSKVWIMGAEFEIRQSNIDRARRILGQAIGMAPKEKIFKKYIQIEIQLGNIDRCRILYEKYLECLPGKCNAWIRFANLERTLGERERARAIFELAIDQPELDMPELLWKAYIDFEISGSEYERARALYERLLNRTKHVNVWISYAMFEAAKGSGLHDDETDDEATRKCRLEQARRVFERGLDYFRDCVPDSKEDRAVLSEEWLRIKRGFATEIGDVGFVEYLFPDETRSSNTKLLEAAYKWKKQQKKTVSV